LLAIALKINAFLLLTFFKTLLAHLRLDVISKKLKLFGLSESLRLKTSFISCFAKIQNFEEMSAG
jgi:hypothetical protein